MEGHTLAEFDSTNAVAQLTSRGQLLHLSLTSAAGSQSRQLREVYVGGSPISL